MHHLCLASEKKTAITAFFFFLHAQCVISTRHFGVTMMMKTHNPFCSFLHSHMLQVCCWEKAAEAWHVKTFQRHSMWFMFARFLQDLWKCFEKQQLFLPQLTICEKHTALLHTVMHHREGMKRDVTVKEHRWTESTPFYMFLTALRLATLL